MKKAIIMALTFLLAATATFAQTKQSSVKTQQHSMATKKYTCPMHPEVVRNKPGKCPKCGMKLVPMKMKMSKSMGNMKM